MGKQAPGYGGRGFPFVSLSIANGISRANVMFPMEYRSLPDYQDYNVAAL